MHFMLIALLLFLNSCVPPVYEEITCDIREFICDSQYIKTGKQAILEFEDKCGDEEDNAILSNKQDVVIEGDELSLIICCPKRPEREQAITRINQTIGFKVINHCIVIPYIGEVEVAGLTLKEVTSAIEDLHREQFSNVKVYVDFRKKNARFVQMIGADKPYIQIDTNTKLSEVIARAQIDPNTNLFDSYLMREEEKLPIDFYRLIHLGDENQNIFVQSGDQLFFAPADTIHLMVTGEIQSKVISLPYGFMSLIEALAYVNGIPYTGDTSHIYVIRGELKRPKIYSLAWQDIVQEPHTSLLLMHGDIIYLCEKPITQWNRFISELQISIGVFQTGCQCYNHGFAF